MEAIGMDSIVVEMMIKGKKNKKLYQRCPLCAQVINNFLPVSKLLLNDMEVPFNLKEYSVRDPDGQVIAMRLCEDNLYVINFTKCMKQMWPNWYNIKGKNVHVSLGIIGLDI
jgi:hypothetical protein